MRESMRILKIAFAQASLIIAIPFLPSAGAQQIVTDQGAFADWNHQTPGARHRPVSKTNGPVPHGLGPDRVCCSVASVVSPLVSPTREPQLRNGRTTPPDTAIARSKAIAPFLAYEDLGDDWPFID